MKGKLITIVGINNIGKTTQVKLLPESMSSIGFSCVTQKYPVYDCEPTGSRINSYIRNKNPEGLTPTEFQYLCAENRRDFEPKLKALLNENDFVVAEMYNESGLAFGLGYDVDEQALINMNKGLLQSDLVILFDGERFLEAKEIGHYFEKNDQKIDRIRQIHLDLAKKYNWVTINANMSVDEVQVELIKTILNSFAD